MLAAAEALVAKGEAKGPTWRQPVGDLRAEQRRLGSRWLVTDFVRLGSSLAHANLLLAGGGGDLASRIGRRELPTSPQFCEKPGHFSYERDSPRRIAAWTPTARVVDHAAVFGVAAWTNQHFPCRALLKAFDDRLRGPLHHARSYRRSGCLLT
ncbi:hypothetical protein [Novosphingobium sp. Gsoil 351]|uniref:hypothetical protein n=1 Tax=Novosphingobium sp. Gsoil 351 TaxID=2675225 RepID=UPI0012B4F0EB|nr:hypothetical protein [Novosphingobium sp. Gsoil 351]QGN55628.1 hypothetical protein GKE62_14825 [Novosphingobium sp. Gsoil 351]